MKIVLAGAGNAASHLGPLLKRKGHKIIQVYNRSKKSGAALASILKCQFTSDPIQLIQDADIYIIALSDGVIQSFSEKLTFIPKLIAHTSGTCSIDIFPKKMTNAGVFYPLQTFTKDHKSPSNIPFCIEGRNKKTTAILKILASDLGGEVYEKNSIEREFIHLAAVLSNNFTNHLFTLSKKLLKDNNTPFEILKPLIMETVLKIQSADPYMMQTGPARRGDLAVIKKHIKLLNKYPEIKEIYKKISKSIIKEYK